MAAATRSPPAATKQRVAIVVYSSKGTFSANRAIRHD